MGAGGAHAGRGGGGAWGLTRGVPCSWRWVFGQLPTGVGPPAGPGRPDLQEGKCPGTPLLTPGEEASHPRLLAWLSLTFLLQETGLFLPQLPVRWPGRDRKRGRRRSVDPSHQATRPLRPPAPGQPQPGAGLGGGGGVTHRPGTSPRVSHRRGPPCSAPSPDPERPLLSACPSGSFLGPGRWGHHPAPKPKGPLGNVGGTPWGPALRTRFHSALGSRTDHPQPSPQGTWPWFWPPGRVQWAAHPSSGQPRTGGDPPTALWGACKTDSFL